MKTLFSLVLFLAITACSFGPKQTAPITIYDFGMQPVAQNNERIRASLTVQDITAPIWLNSTAIYYRLGYQDPTKPQAYANSRWIASPPGLLGLRLRQNISAATKGGIATSADGVKSDYTLRLELEEFCQVFDNANSSHAVVRLRATLVGQNTRNLVAQKSFVFEHPAPTPNAEGGVKSLVGASDELIAAVVDWVASQKL